ncbi:hypothetical protein SAMN05216184_11270 [Georgenia satyanarayanai]|uniref:Uncharacterized protein n=1 Tax=Georgenia satyanarayanai TaxID=860221 RepID=A0A2Y9AL82_9MICO|nr:hypothetical protein [Georgenia satyanarayanai]PYF98326.1 hypothetical protein A8987_11270 [Georgenia satyanarayanai]SSA45211.1 hypothetical protein SAMN05216184_11270 [Georgenia satyanarayanai]
MSQPKRRLILPGLLIAAGLAGFGLAAASELDLDWGGTFQAGAVTVEADCQSGAIDVTFAAPEFEAAAAAAPWSVDALSFSGISATCVNTTYEVAVRTAASGATWTELGTGTVAGTTLSVPLGSGVKAETIADVALTMHKPAG